MNAAEIIILTSLGVVTVTIIICIILYSYLDGKYKHFYTEADQGYDLILLLTEMDKILDREQLLTNRGADLRKMINDRKNYYIINFDIALELDSLRSDYMDVISEYEELIQRKANCQKAIDEIIDKLPKRYKGALNYNWRQFKK